MVFQNRQSIKFFADLLLESENDQPPEESFNGQEFKATWESDKHLGSLGVLPIEIFQQIFSWLNVPEILSLHEVSKAFHFLSHNEDLWRKVTEEEFSTELEKHLPKNVPDWKAHYKEYYFVPKIWGIWSLTTDHNNMSFEISLSLGQVTYVPDPSSKNSWDFHGDSITIIFNGYSTYSGKLLSKKHPLVLCGFATNKAGNSWNWTATKLDIASL